MAVLARRFLTYDGVIYAPGAVLPPEVNMRGVIVTLDLAAIVARGEACDPAECPLTGDKCCGRKPAKPRAPRKRSAGTSG